VTLSIESSDSFVASAAVSIATGWSEPVPGRELHPLKSSAFSRRTFSPIDPRAVTTAGFSVCLGVLLRWTGVHAKGIKDRCCSDNGRIGGQKNGFSRRGSLRKTGLEHNH
jgi:hypothetical protein